MRNFHPLLLFCFICLGCRFNDQSNDFRENEIVDSVTAVIDSVIDYTLQRDLDKMMALYADSKEFRFIDDEGIPKSFIELKALYQSFFASLDHLKLLESHIEVEPLSNDHAYCVWRGKEELRMQGGELMQSAWIATIILKRIDGEWKIIHFHSTHQS